MPIRMSSPQKGGQGVVEELSSSKGPAAQLPRWTSSTSILGMGVKSEGGGLEGIEYEPGPLCRFDVEVEVKYCRLSENDVSVIKGERGVSKFPFIPGHGVVGRVSAIGNAVTFVSVGDIVGLCSQDTYCMKCDYCMSGRHNLCSEIERISVDEDGGFAERVRAHEASVVLIPHNMDLTTACPLICAGAQVFNAILQHGLRPTDRVGVHGIGGALGGMALQFCRAWGCEVVAFTGSMKKSTQELAKKLGAHIVVRSQVKEDFIIVQKRLDLIISTVNIHFPRYLKCLSADGRIIQLGTLAEDAKIPVSLMITKQLKFCGGAVGPPQSCRKMLKFAARHNIIPVIETHALSEIQAVVEGFVPTKTTSVVIAVDFPPRPRSSLPSLSSQFSGHVITQFEKQQLMPTAAFPQPSQSSSRLSTAQLSSPASSNPSAPLPAYRKGNVSNENRPSKEDDDDDVSGSPAFPMDDLLSTATADDEERENAVVGNQQGGLSWPTLTEVPNEEDCADSEWEVVDGTGTCGGEEGPPRFPF